MPGKAKLGTAKQQTTPPKHWWELKDIIVDVSSADWHVGEKATLPGGTLYPKGMPAQIEVQQVNILGDMQLASIFAVGKYIRPPKNPVAVSIGGGGYPSAYLILDWLRRNA